MKCPLFSDKNERRTLETIEFCDLKQLEDIEEGYIVEYKSDFEKDVKRKMPKEISSFANASGGWIFIGVDDDGKYVGVKQGRADFSQVIGQIVHRHIMPFPLFETRFVRDPNDNDGRGVLIIEVQEGIEPPYIADGDVYVRIGSSSEHMEKADGFTLIDLYRKARRYKEEMDEFCHRDIYLPPSYIRDGEETFSFPVFNAYMKHIVAKPDETVYFAEIDEVIERFRRLYEKKHSGRGFYCQHAYHSLIFREKLGVITDDVGPTIELFYDGSMKIAVPMAYVQTGHERDSLLDAMQSIRPIRNADLVKNINGKDSLYLVLSPCLVVDEYLEAIGRNLSEYALAIEFENMQGMLVYYDTEEYRDYVRENGYLNIGTLDAKSRPYVPNGYNSDSEPEESVQAFVQLRFMEGLGLPIATADTARAFKLLSMMGIHTPKENANNV